MQPTNFRQLLEEYRTGTMDDAQRADFEKLLHDPQLEDELRRLLDESLQQTDPVTADATREYLYERIKEYIREEEGSVGRRIPFLKRTWVRYAAAAILIIGVGVYFLKTDKIPATEIVIKKTEQPLDFEPGHDGAILTLSDGRQVMLDTTGNGIIAHQNGAQVVLKDGSLTYNAKGQNGSGWQYNTMRTPRGRQFQLVLPDGSKVWLNAASSITYPTAFTGATREVKIEGEAYFEVVKSTMPFKVKIDEQNTVEVLGTHFNINAYHDEGCIKTTLLEGRVKIVNRETADVKRENAVELKPGQQVEITHDSRLTIHDNADLDRVMAWRRGLFNFDGYDIKAVMREISRWYDLDIRYEAEPEQEEVAGEIQRSLTLSQVMKVLQKIDVKYRVEGRTLIVMDKNQ